jgi:hypothetical protein
LRINYNDLSQVGEIIDLKWMDIDQIKIIDTHNRIYPIIRAANKILRKKYKIQKIYEFNLFPDDYLQNYENDEKQSACS